MDNPTVEVTVDVQQTNSEENDQPRSSPAAVESTNASIFDVPIEENRRRRRHPRHRRRQRHYHGVRNGQVRYEKTLLHFSAAHILLGIVCVLLQVIDT